MKKIALTTLGCRFNQNETLEMEESLRSGYEIAPYASIADVYVINTCTVTSKSDHKCRQLIRSTFKRAPTSKIVVTGCYAETQQKEIKCISGVSLVAGNSEKSNIKALIDELFAIDGGASQPVGSQSTLPVPDSSAHVPLATSVARTSAYLKVQTGCDMSCSYCIVTVARGRGRSKPVEEIKREFKKLVFSGVNEILLTGINLGCYGNDFYRKVSVAELLSELLLVDGVRRIRLSSINPAEVSDDLIDLMKSNKAICRHLHIPLQSGDDNILKSMRRNYTRELFRNLANRLCCEVEGIGIGTDVMVGFPGEDERAFSNTYDLIRELPLSYLHVFRYSKRNGTDANGFAGQVSNAVKLERSKKLIELGCEKEAEFRKRHLNSVVEVLFETRPASPAHDLVGYSDNYIPIIAEGAKSVKNSIRSVKLLSIEAGRVRGSLIHTVRPYEADMTLA